MFTDAPDRFPVEDVPVWWEVWLRRDGHERFVDAAAAFRVRVKPTERLTFPEREVVLANATVTAMGNLMANTDTIAELRIASDTPAVFLGFRNFEQGEWVRDLAQRVRVPNGDVPAVCILDSGITHTHQLLNASIGPGDVHTYDPSWGTGDSPAWQGHGTAMAGIALYGDVQQRLLNPDLVFLQHGLESVKLRWHDVDWMGSKLNVEHGIVNQHLDSVKTEGSRKTMTLDAQLLQILAAWKQVTQFREADDWLFPSPVKLGRLPYSYTGYWRALQTATGRAGLGRMGTHTFRHTYRSWLDSVGTAITVQQKLMRHSDIKTTLNIYGDVVTDEMERAGSKIAALAFNPDSKVIPAAVSH
jgi:hypothetical protein